MKRIIFVLFFICTSSFTPIFPAFACALTMGSKWYTFNYAVNTDFLPQDVEVTYTPYPILSTHGDQTYTLLQLDKYHYDIDEYPKGYVPIYRFSKDSTEKFNSYTKNWEVINQVIIYPDYLSREILYFYKSGYGRVMDKVPKPMTVNIYLYYQHKIHEIPIQVTYALNPTYDPFLEKRPDVSCGERISSTPILAQLIYFFFMSINLLHFHEIISIISYDLSHQDINAYSFVGIWTILIIVVTYILIRKLKK